ncbi:MAG: hypothetical protein GX537_05780, partial [Actinobacteria bacterium]|nr:hypothetical protein [Actinomycetota bacterium]
AGSPQAQRVMIARQSNLNHKKELAKVLAGVGKELPQSCPGQRDVAAVRP